MIQVSLLKTNINYMLQICDSVEERMMTCDAVIIPSLAHLIMQRYQNIACNNNLSICYYQTASLFWSDYLEIECGESFFVDISLLTFAVASCVGFVDTYSQLQIVVQTIEHRLHLFHTHYDKQYMMDHSKQTNPKFSKCLVCQKQFARYDQRGFQNPGFTAHQNRCIERRFQFKKVKKSKSKPKVRALLPAPSRHSYLMPRLSDGSNSSNSNTLYTEFIGDCTLIMISPWCIRFKPLRCLDATNKN
ncbi:hypothetical protein BD560DRAFT_422314 [Blakeslea trispora]|nr:hypothetical protein BD560DRAFT_422314 [Blakeslea trispora]